MSLIGSKMLLESFGKQKDNTILVLSIPVLLTLSFATSIDALITGIGFGFIDVGILRAGLIIFAVTFIITLAGSRIGQQKVFLSARWAERIGGIVLILIGLNILLNHMGCF
jgi:putative Mn2+ efflux pump MntP